MSNFKEVEEKVFSLYRDGKYEEALQFVQKIKKNYLKYLSRLYYYEACLLSVLNKKDEAIKILNEALNFGFWWSVNTLNNEKDFNSIRDSIEFKEIIEKIKKIEDKEKKLIKREYLIFEPIEIDKNKNYPILIFLHPRDSNVYDFSKYFDLDNLKKNYYLLFPQSPIKTSFDGYSWDDAETSYKEIIEILKEVLEKYKNINNQEIVISGASQGARISLEIYLKKLINLKGWIGIIPAFRDLNYLFPLLDSLKGENLKFSFIVGKKDYYFYKIAYELNNELIKREFKTLFIENENLGHSIPKNFEEQLFNCLNFIFGFPKFYKQNYY
ncbi:MAG: hypothetical protein QMD25_06695 [Caldisericia bacterium]|jgi:predicted esterase|nr:hypothetical protein [Caldisericia bacterium]